MFQKIIIEKLLNYLYHSKAKKSIRFLKEIVVFCRIICFCFIVE